MHKNHKQLLSNFFDILSLTCSKAVIDQSEDWCKGSSTYFDEIKKELDEVQEELQKENNVYLEDELGDVLWDYLNLLKHLELEEKITIENVFKRCKKKYTERLHGRKNGEFWNDVKKRQKEVLAKEQKNYKK
ncbi:MAG: nucleotide pyrophosphohydrolase [Candidatus Moraniibacteriota bacterium]|nr:MAG: nucleotide pyrophosphohydrolase [Candidatus Moranbacteria bacterium]